MMDVSLSEKYLPVAIFLIVGLLFPAITFLLTRFFRPRKEIGEKHHTYECGEVPAGEAHIQFNFQYYSFALLFVVFDIIIVFLMIWALTFSTFSDEKIILSIGPFGISEKLTTGLFIGAFMVILSIGVYYALRKEERIWI